MLRLGVNKETEFEISKDKFEKLKEKQDPTKNTVYKTRLTFEFKNQIFELDIFHKNLEGLIILELELKDTEQEVELPELNIVKEVTKDKKYSNYNLADY